MKAVQEEMSQSFILIFAKKIEKHFIIEILIEF